MVRRGGEGCHPSNLGIRQCLQCSVLRWYFVYFVAEAAKNVRRPLLLLTAQICIKLLGQFWTVLGNRTDCSPLRKHLMKYTSAAHAR